MLDLVYIALVLLPLTIAAVALLMLAVRGVRDDRPREPRVSAAPVASRVGPSATKRCPDCAEEVLAAARVCKHCRYRFDEPEYGASLSA